MNPQLELEILGRVLGGPEFAQGAGGNVSVKHDGQLFVKASGTRLVHTAREGGHAVVSLEIATRALEGDPAAEQALFAVTPRPSMETFFHALPPRVVVHVHAIGSLLAACAPKGAVPWPGPQVPYHPPGRVLALAVRPWVEADAEATILLASHGVLLFGVEVRSVVDRLVALEAAILSRFPHAPPFAEYLQAYLGPAFSSSRRIPDRRAFQGYLFPDAVVYAPIVPDGASETTIGLHRSKDGTRRVVARHAAALDGVCEIIAAHDWVEDVLVGAGISPVRLTDAAAEALRVDPAEAYRQDRGTTP